MKLLNFFIAALSVCLISCQKEYTFNTCTTAANNLMAVKNYSTYPLDKWATLAFEDNWPNLGDTDMNDLVVSYRYRFAQNTNGDIVQLLADFTVVASGASFHNGLGVELPFAPSMVQSVTGQVLNGGYTKTNANGTEAGQTNAVIIPFDNHEEMLHYPDYAYFINVEPLKQRITGDTAHIVINFTKPVNSSIIDKAPFNPFLISDMRRGVEIHLPGGKPTNKADKSLFNTSNDYTKGDTHYVTKKGFPWVLNFTDTGFNYPVENAPITSAYRHYAAWAQSGGKKYTDWNSNAATGYRNNKNIFY